MLSGGYLCLSVAVVVVVDEDDDAPARPLNSPVAPPGTRAERFRGSFRRLAAVCDIAGGGRGGRTPAAHKRPLGTRGAVSDGSRNTEVRRWDAATRLQVVF